MTFPPQHRVKLHSTNPLERHNGEIMPNMPVSRLELGPWPDGPAGGSLIARTTHVYTIDHVATLIGENLELLREVASNSDNIDYGEMIHVQDGTEQGITTFTDRGLESLQEFLADVRTWNGGVRQFLIDQQCEPDVIERIMAKEQKP
jgi:hypothetical protein